MVDIAVSDTSTQESVGALEVKTDAGKGAEAEVRRWLMEIKLAEDTFKKWRKLGKEVVQRYRSDEKLKGKRNRYNILWANTETLRPALYDSTPRPDIRRRYRDADPLGKEVAEVLERATSFSLDAYDFDSVMEGVILDYLLPGRGVARVRYVPSFRQNPPDENNPGGYESLSYEEVNCEAVHWDQFLHGPGRCWSDVQWVAFEHLLTRDDLKENFGGLGAKIPLDHDMRPDEGEETEDESDKNVFKRLKVWEIWDKETRRIFFIAPSFKKAPLKVDEDPLGLKGFFPIPRPIVSIESPGSLVPTPEYQMYRKQAEELDKVSLRIDNLIEGLKVRGIYDGTIAEFNRLVNATDNDLIPAQNVTSLIERGGLDKAIWMMPIETAAVVLKELYLQRDQIKQVIYEITGISDIIRGASDPRETATAQNLKGRFGALRLERRQRDVARFARDLIRLKAEILAERFQPQTLSIMTGKEVRPEHMAVMRQDAAREFRIDIETDSTIARQLTEDQQAVTELLGGIAQFATAIGPAVQGGFFPAEVAIEMVKSAARRAKLGREVDNLMEETAPQPGQMQPQQKQGPSPEEVAAQQQAQDKQAEMQLRAQESQQKLALQAQDSERKAQIEVERMNREDARFQAQQQFEREKAIADLSTNREMAMMKLEDSRMARQESRDDADTQRRLDGLPTSTFEDDMEQIGMGLQQLAQALVVMAQQQTAQNEAIIQLMSAPKRLVRDAQGRPVGVEIDAGNNL